MINAVLIIALMSASYLPAQGQGIKMNFTPESEKFAQATKQYQEIWRSGVMKEVSLVSGVQFLQIAVLSSRRTALRVTDIVVEWAN